MAGDEKEDGNGLQWCAYMRQPAWVPTSCALFSPMHCMPEALYSKLQSAMAAAGTVAATESADTANDNMIIGQKNAQYLSGLVPGM